MPYLPPEQKFAEHRPRLGDTIEYMGVDVGKVSKIEGALCYVTARDGLESPFIWCFEDGLNAFHTWPTKRNGAEAPIARHRA